jgi:4-aminobutyrate aminotransferase-like enzyme
MDLSERLLALKHEYLVPCAYHFYRRPPVLVRGAGAYLYDAEGRAYNVLTIMPPLVVEQEALDTLVDCLDEQLARRR